MVDLSKILDECGEQEEKGKKNGRKKYYDEDTEEIIMEAVDEP